MFNNNLLSIDIGNKNLKLLIGRKKGKNVFVEKVYNILTPEGSYDDGHIVDSGRLKEEIEKIPEIASGRVKHAVITSKSTSIISREVIVPRTDKKEEIEQLVHFELEQYLPISMEENIIQYVLIENLIEDNIEKMRLDVVVYPKSIAEGYLNLLKELKLKPVALDLNYNCIYKLFSNKLKINDIDYSKDETIALIDMGNNNSSILVISKGKLDFNRIIPYGGKFINVNIKKKLLTSLEESEEMKVKIDNLRENSDGNYEIVKEAIDEGVGVFIKEMERVFQFYRNKKVGNKIDKVFLYGGSGKLNGLTEVMSETLNIPVFKIESMSNIIIDKNVDNFDIEYFLNGVGALVRL